MRAETQALSVAVPFMLILFSLACLPASLPAAVPGLDGGVMTWTNQSSEPFTVLKHRVMLYDYDGVSSTGDSHTVRVTYPDTTVKILPPIQPCLSATSCLYDWDDATIDQGNISSYSGTYTYRAEKTSNPASFSEASDVLDAYRMGVPNESTFSPKHVTPQSIIAYFDNVYVNGSLFDDFSAGLNPSLWSWDPRWANAENGQAKFSVDFNPGRGSYYLNMNNPTGVNQLKSTVKVTNVTGNKPIAGINARFVKDHVGDVFASVGIRGTQAVWTIGPERYDGDHYRGLYYVSNAVLGTVAVGKRYDLILDFDVSTNTFMFRVKGLDDAVDYSASYALNGIISPAPTPSAGIGVNAWVQTSTTPDFNWTPIDGANHYRVRIVGLNNNTVFNGFTSAPPFKLPPGILKPSSFYKYRIDAVRDHLLFDWDNVATSDWELTGFATLETEAEQPYIDIDVIGVETFTDTVFGTMMSFYIKVYDAQGVPQNIASAKVAIPGGGEVDLYLDTNEGVNCGIYKGTYFAGLPAGIYTFTVADKEGNTHSVSDTLIVNPINPPEESALVPAENLVVGDTGILFDWEDVPGASLYEVQIFDKNMNRIRILRSEDSQANLPPGLLKEGSYYRYRIAAAREFFENNISNDTSTAAAHLFEDAQSFFTTGKAGSPSNPPIISAASPGVRVRIGPHPVSGTLYYLEFSLQITDADGVPENIKSVEVTFPDGVTKKLLKFGGSSYFEHQIFTNASLIPTGIYKFTVTDFEGNEAMITDELSGVPAFAWPVVLSPADGSIVSTATPIITWTPVADASYYRVRITNAFGLLGLFLSEKVPAPSTTYTIPTSVLQSNRSYGIRVMAYLETPAGAASEVDIYSGSSTMAQNNTHVTLPDTVAGPSISVTPIDQNTGSTPAEITFAQVNSSGTTTLASSASGAPPPSGFKLGNPGIYYDISTSAVYSGSIRVCINYDDTYFQNENELRLYHYENSAWVDRTELPIDTTNNIICGNVTSLSPFALFEPKYCLGDLDTDGDGDGSDLHALIRSFAGASGEGDINGDGHVNNSDLLIFLNSFGHNDCAATP